MRFALFLSAFLFLTLSARAQEESTPPVEATADASSAGDYQAVLDEWESTRSKTRQMATLYANSNEQTRAKLLPDFVQTMEAAADFMPRLVPALEAAYQDKPDDPKLRELILDVAMICTDLDQQDFAYRTSRLIAANSDDNALAEALAGRSAYELGKLDEAEPYLRSAKKLGGLDLQNMRLVDRMLLRLVKRKPVLAKEAAKVAAEEKADDLPRVKLTTTRGDVVIELFENEMPNTVASFLRLVQSGFYNDKEFFRVVQGFGSLAGSPTNDGQGGPGYETPREQSPEGARPHQYGYVSMVPGERGNGSQFFIVCHTSHCEGLDGKQDVFGRVVEGMTNVARFRPFDRATNQFPDLQPDKIIKAEIVRKRDHEYAAYSIQSLAEEKLQDGLRLFGQQKFAEAEQAFREALKTLPDSASLHFNLAATLLSQKKMDDAETHFKEALAHNAKHVKARQFLANVYVSRGDYAEAINLLQAGLETLPGDPTLTEYLRQVQAKSQEPSAKASN